MGHSEVDQVVEPADRGIQGAFRGEGAEVELVDQPAGELPARPRLVGPGERGAVEPRRRLVHTPRLTPRTRVGSHGVGVVEDEPVLLAVRQRDIEPPPAALAAFEVGIRSPALASQTHALGPWRPDLHHDSVLGRQQRHGVPRQEFGEAKARPAEAATGQDVDRRPGVAQQHGVTPAAPAREAHRQTGGDGERSASVECDRMIGCLAHDGHRGVPREEVGPVSAEAQSTRGHQELRGARLVDRGQLSPGEPGIDVGEECTSRREVDRTAVVGVDERRLPQFGPLVDVGHARPGELQQLRAERVRPAEVPDLAHEVVDP